VGAAFFAAKIFAALRHGFGVAGKIRGANSRGGAG